MDDTSRRVGDEMRGRGDESARGYGTERTPTAGAAGARGVPAVPPTPEPPRPSGRTDESLDPDTARRTEEIRAEIEQTREDMSETIEAIQEKLRPGNIVANATDRVKQATTERVRNMAESASETAQSAMETTRRYAGDVMSGSSSSKVIPAAMIGIGAAWLLIDRIRNRDDDYGRRGYNYGEERGGSRYGVGRYEPAEYYAGGGYREYDEGVEYAGEYASERTGGASERYRRVTSKAGEAVSGARESAVRTGRRARGQFERLLHDNPLMVGAAALVVGAAVGLALPETERENEWMGEAKENVIDRAQDMARGAASRAQEAAGDVAGELASRVVGGKEEK